MRIWPNTAIYRTVNPIVAQDRLPASAGALLQQPLTEEAPLGAGLHPGCSPEAGASKAPNTLAPWLLLYSYGFINAAGGSTHFVRRPPVIFLGVGPLSSIDVERGENESKLVTRALSEEKVQQ